MSSVPESLLKRQRASQRTKLTRLEKIKELKKTRTEKRQIIFKRAEDYVKEYRANAKALDDSRLAAKKAGSFFLEPEAKLVVVTRIRGIMGVDPRSKKILRLFRLRRIHSTVFLRLNRPIIKMLRLVEPYITYGYPTQKTVADLIYKRGAAKINGQRIPINSNEVIEERLGSKGIICVEDLVHEIFTVGPHFKEANRFLWPFALNSPKGGYVAKRRHFIEGGDAGNREQYINDFVQRMI
eukprot:CAMPEP_0184655640 /NCGR_PEP_ID=MMETSP0308-20130426/14107_1 /TAXON_ID=38269 /ORGANISM="Gloeochaete witrockiana, Strain SAG 46.84" /LENGTH=238 /DNA_ID=CAMNT_0027092261 /DNA_START=16 /DNA_END=732 /DNA_ORIENTATION=+